MGLIFLDSFDDRYFTTGASYSTYHAKWDVVFEDSSSSYANSLEQVTGRTGKACKLGGTSYLQKTNISSNQLIWGLALKVLSAPASDTTIVEIEVNYNETQYGYIKYVLTTSLTLKIYTDTNEIAESNSSLSTNTFYYIESYNNVLTYTTDLKKDGSNWLNVSPTWSISWPESIITSIKFSGGVIIDDLYLVSDNSVSLNQPKINAIIPNSNGTADTNAWQSVSYLDVDECFQVNHDGNTTYDESNTASPSRVSYNFTDLSVNSIKGIQTLSWVAGYWNNIGAAANIDMTAITRVANTYYESNTKSVSSSSTPVYVLLTGLWENNPNTSTAWTSSNYNGAEFGVKASPSSNNIGRLTAITVEVAYDYETTPPVASRVFIIS